ncbi:hypothetical protein C500_13776 [Natrialba magadii ATCC 43099]|uniref:Uncharacterized protein n=1 Tax=Natrialba magadii (strain ATCC 43099 / DSM 3394 / CCM 3739 / CIP 104546 / IAM 13178 / JCM 8861 / NBRC 102185 / NCIMB 2190 / MS3) TaxID=547559 RepID=L9UU19_NATMM|nr:hypothetical protein C500_13776 [Natrialba magadii ATCC 43099]
MSSWFDEPFDAILFGGPGAVPYGVAAMTLFTAQLVVRLVTMIGALELYWRLRENRRAAVVDGDTTRYLWYRCRTRYVRAYVSTTSRKWSPMEREKNAEMQAGNRP